MALKVSPKSNLHIIGNNNLKGHPIKRQQEFPWSHYENKMVKEAENEVFYLKFTGQSAFL